MAERLFARDEVALISGSLFSHLSTRVSDRAYIIEKGRIRYEGSMAELADNEEIRAACLMV